MFGWESEIFLQVPFPISGLDIQSGGIGIRNFFYRTRIECKIRPSPNKALINTHTNPPPVFEQINLYKVSRPWFLVSGCALMSLSFPSRSVSLFVHLTLASYRARTYLSKIKAHPGRDQHSTERRTGDCITVQIGLLHSRSGDCLTWADNGPRTSCRAWNRVGSRATDNRHFSGKILEFGEGNSRDLRSPLAPLHREWW